SAPRDRRLKQGPDVGLLPPLGVRRPRPVERRTAGARFPPPGPPGSPADDADRLGRVYNTRTFGLGARSRPRSGGRHGETLPWPSKAWTVTVPRASDRPPGSARTSP